MLTGKIPEFFASNVLFARGIIMHE